MKNNKDKVVKTKYFVDESGKYLGGFGGINPQYPKNAQEILTPPLDGRQEYDFKSKQWNDTAETDGLLKENQQKKYISELNCIDLKSIRSLRDGDTKRIAKFESEAQEIRKKLKALS